MAPSFLPISWARPFARLRLHRTTICRELTASAESQLTDQGLVRASWTFTKSLLSGFFFPGSVTA